MEEEDFQTGGGGVGWILRKIQRGLKFTLNHQKTIALDCGKLSQSWKLYFLVDNGGYQRWLCIINFLRTRGKIRISTPEAEAERKH